MNGKLKETDFEFALWIRQGRYTLRNGYYYSRHIKGAGATIEGLYDMFVAIKRQFPEIIKQLTQNQHDTK